MVVDLQLPAFLSFLYCSHLFLFILVLCFPCFPFITVSANRPKGFFPFLVHVRAAWLPLISLDSLFSFPLSFVNPLWVPRVYTPHDSAFPYLSSPALKPKERKRIQRDSAKKRIGSASPLPYVLLSPSPYCSLSGSSGAFTPLLPLKSSSLPVRKSKSTP